MSKKKKKAATDTLVVRIDADVSRLRRNLAVLRRDIRALARELDKLNLSVEKRAVAAVSDAKRRGGSFGRDFA